MSKQMDINDLIPDEIKDDDFCEEYERMLNRVRYLVRQAVPIAPKITEPISKRYTAPFLTCGQCGFGLKEYYTHCPKCGRAIKWN